MVQQPQNITIKVNTTSLFLSMFAAVLVAVFAAYMLMKSEFASAIQQQTATQTPVVVAQPGTCVAPAETKGADTASSQQQSAWSAPAYHGMGWYGASSITQNQTDNHSVTNTTNNTSTTTTTNVVGSYNTTDSYNRMKLDVDIEDSFNIASYNTMKNYHKTVNNTQIDDHSTNVENNTTVRNSEEVIVLNAAAALAPLGL